MEKLRIEIEEVSQIVLKTFIKYGYSEENAKICQEVLLMADLHSIDSHGIARLPGYVRLIEVGRINPKAKNTISRERVSTANIDAGGAIGLVSAYKAMDLAIQKAKSSGIAFVTIHNSNHFGIAQAHAVKALAENQIGFAMTNASPLVSPAGAKLAYLGTNPICYVVPTGLDFPFICDVATSAVSNGKIELKQYSNLSIPTGWALDKNGTESTNNQVLKEGGTLLPLGSDETHSYHKGYALGGLVDILTGVLSGSNFGKWVPPFVSFLDVDKSVGKGIGHVVGAIDIEAFMDYPEFIERMHKWIAGIKELPTIDGNPMLIPGEPEHIAYQKNFQNGYLEISEKVWKAVQNL